MLPGRALDTQHSLRRYPKLQSSTATPFLPVPKGDGISRHSSGAGESLWL